MNKFVLFAVAFVLVASVAQADWVTATIPTGDRPGRICLNPVTNRIYVVHEPALIWPWSMVHPMPSLPGFLLAQVRLRGRQSTYQQGLCAAVLWQCNWP